MQETAGRGKGPADQHDGPGEGGPAASPAMPPAAAPAVPPATPPSPFGSGAAPASPPAPSGAGEGGRRPSARGWAALQVAALALCLLLAVLLHRALGGWLYSLDDAYIVLSNVEALLALTPPSPGGPLLLGATSLLHTLLAAPFVALLGPEPGLWILCWLGVAAAGMGVLALARGCGLSPAWGAALLFCAFAPGLPPYALINGLETSWMLAALFWTFRAFQRDTASPVGAALCGLLPFVRPELGIFSACFMAVALWPLRARPGRAARLAALCLAPALGLLALQWALTGAPLPSTGSAKRMVFNVAADAPLRRLVGFLMALQQFCALAGLVWLAALYAQGRAARTAMGGALLLSLALGGWYGAIVQQNGDRLLWDFVPAMVFAAASALAAPWRSLRGGIARLAIIASLPMMAADLPRRVSVSVDHMIGGSAHEARMAAWIEANIPPGAPIMVHDVGYVTWATEARIVDFVGLRSPGAVAVHRRTTGLRGAAAAAEAARAIMEEEAVCVFLLLNDWNAKMGLVAGMRDAGWTAARLTPPDMPIFSVWRFAAPAGSGAHCAAGA